MNNYQQHIHEYLDGALPAHLQEELFSEMSMNEELRKEFSLQLSVQQKVSADVATIIAPDDIKENVFAQIGLPLHSPVSSVSEALIPLPAFSGFFSIGSIAFIALITGAFSTWFFLQVNNTTPLQGNTENIITQSSSKVKNKSIENNNTPAQYNRSTFDGFETKRAKIISTPSFSIIDTEKNQDNNMYGNTNYESINTENTNTETIHNSPLRNYSVTHNFPTSQIHNSLDFIQTPYFDENNIQLRVASISPIGTNAHSAFIAQCMYELDEGNSIGVEYSDGSYSQTKQVLIDGEELSLKENRKFTGISATYQHNFTSLQLFDIIPMLQVSLGGTTTGQPIGRYSVGVRWTPESRISLTIGADVSVLGYRSENSWNTSVNTGIVSGVNIRF